MSLKFKKSFVFFCAVFLIHLIMPVFGDDIQQIDENFYVGKMPSKKLWLAMERIDDSNFSLWKHYVSVQSHPRSSTFAEHLVDKDNNPLQKGSIGGASFLANAILNDVSYVDNEIWVAYITKAAIPQKIPNDIISYNAENVMSCNKPFAKDIEMFMTVTSSPQALITSHMGIAASVEGVRDRAKGTSLDLHSFTAKVMLKRKPERKYMVNAPLFIMEKIITDALPDFVFVGTREMQKIMEERQQVSLSDFTKQNRERINEEVAREANDDCDVKNKLLKNDLDALKRSSRKDETEISIRKNISLSLKYTLLEMSTEGIVVVSESKRILRIDEQIEEEFQLFINPYPYPPANDRATRSVDFLEFMTKHSPILSVDGEKTIRSNFTLFNPKKPTEPWLTVDNRNKDYEWMFQPPFQPMGLTHYMVVDLVALAESRTREDIKLFTKNRADD